MLSPAAMDPGIIALAGQSQGFCAELLGQLAEHNDVFTLLTVLGRLASPSCLWLEGDLVVELFEEDDGVRVRVLEDAGGLRERALPAVVFRVPLASVLSEIYEAPELLGDLRIVRVSSRCALLLLPSAEEEDVRSAFEISETCLSASPPPVTLEDLDRGWDEPS
jgi:hypothetical protein